MVYGLYIYTVKIQYLHPLCKINVVNFMYLPYLCVAICSVLNMQFTHLQSPDCTLRCDITLITVTKASGLTCIKPKSQRAIKYCRAQCALSLQSPIFVRAGQAWSAPRFRSARACGYGSPSLSWSTWTPRCFSSSTHVAQGGQPLLGSYFNISLKLQLQNNII